MFDYSNARTNRNEASAAEAEATAERIARHYRLTRQAADAKCRATWRGHCPVHGGRSGTSFKLSVSESGKVLMHCHAGCTVSELSGQLATDIPDLAIGGMPRTRDDVPVAEFIRVAKQAQFSGRTAETDRAVWRALFTIAQRVGSLEVDASVRELAEMAKVQQPLTISRALKRVMKSGWVERLDPGTEVKAGLSAQSTRRSGHARGYASPRCEPLLRTFPTRARWSRPHCGQSLLRRAR